MFHYISYAFSFSSCSINQLMCALNCLAPCTVMSLGTPILSLKYNRHNFTYQNNWKVRKEKVDNKIRKTKSKIKHKKSCLETT